MNEKNIVVDFANLNYIYGEFHKQYSLVCQEISEMKRNSFVKIGDNPIKKFSAIFNEYRVFIKDTEIKKNFDESLYELQDTIEEDDEFTKLANKRKKSTNEQVNYNQLYFKYIIKLFKIIGEFGDELTSTFMPNKSDRKKFLKYRNTNAFFEQFVKYKSYTSKSLAELSIINFREKMVYFLGFYFAYYLFIDIATRQACEEIFGKLISIYTEPKVCSLLLGGLSNLNSTTKGKMKKIDKIFHMSLTSVFSRMNESYSNFGVIPKIEEQIKYDFTLI